MLVAISALSVILVNRAREDNAWVVHTVEVENQISTPAAANSHTESAARGYLLTEEQRFLDEYQTRPWPAFIPDIDEADQNCPADNPAQIENANRLRAAGSGAARGIREEPSTLSSGTTPPAASRCCARPTAGQAVAAHRRDCRSRCAREEERLFALRTQTADRTERLASIVTVAGSGARRRCWPAFRFFWCGARPARATHAEAQLRDNNLNLEATVDERTADLREANNEIQRFAYIVSHDLRSPLVNIMGFTSELEELRADIFKRIAALRLAAHRPRLHCRCGRRRRGALEAEDKQLLEGFFRSPRIHQVIDCENGPADLGHPQSHPRGTARVRAGRIDMRELIEAIVTTVAHQASEAQAQIHIEPLPEITSDRLAVEQIFSNLIDNALKYLKPGVPGDISVRGRTKLGFAIFDVTDNGRGIDPKDHQRIFDLFRRAGLQDKPGQGIGLAHVRALVRRLGGTMSVASELDKGSTFTVTLPINWNVNRRNRDS